jgi:hypothetical protein
LQQLATRAPLQHVHMNSVRGVMGTPMMSVNSVFAHAACGLLLLIPLPLQWLEYFLAYCGALAFEGDPIEWAKNHTCEWCAFEGGGPGGGCLTSCV